MGELIVKDPLGGVKGDDLRTTNPFSVDRKRALTDINLSIDWIEDRKRKSDKTVLQRMRDGTWGKRRKKFQTGNPQQTVNLMALMLY